MAATQATRDGSDRVKALGRLTMSYTVGSVIGPSIGGLLGASGDYYFGAKLAVVGSLISIVLTLLMPNPNEVQSNDESEKPEKENLKSAESSIKEIPSVFQVINVVWLFLATKVITSVANAMAAAALPLIMKNIYGMNESGLGFTMSLMAGFNAIVNGVFLGPIVNWCGNNLNHLIELCILSMTVLSGVQSGLSIPFISRQSPGRGMYEFLAISFVLSMFQYVLSTTITSESTTRVGPLAKGTLLGLEHSLFAAARVIAPTTGVYLLKEGGVAMVSGACAGVFAFVYIGWKFFSYEFNRKYQNESSCKVLMPATTERKEK